MRPVCSRPTGERQGIVDVPEAAKRSAGRGTDVEGLATTALSAGTGTGYDQTAGLGLSQVCHRRAGARSAGGANVVCVPISTSLRSREREMIPSLSFNVGNTVDACSDSVREPTVDMSARGYSTGG
jgi:hypothetical protein